MKCSDARLRADLCGPAVGYDIDCVSGGGSTYRDITPEDEASAFDGKAVGMCENCLQTREQLVTSFVKERRSKK